MIANLVNMLTVILGSTIGLILKKGIPSKISDAVMIGIGICTVYIGYTGSMCGENMLIIIASVILGSIVGTLLKLDERLNNIGNAIETRFNIKSDKGMIAKGFVSASLLFCVGSMTITGALQAGINGDTNLIMTKSMLDFMSSMMLASSLGVGVLLSSIFVLVFQGGITLCAEFIAPYLSIGSINEMSCVGSLITILLGLNLMNVSKFKVADYLPAIVFAPVIYNLVTFFKNLI